MALRLLRDLIAVAPLGDPDKIGSIFVPQQAKQRTDQGIVMYRGPQCKELRVGDHVFFSGYTGTKVYLEEHGELIFMSEQDVAFANTSEPADMLIPRRKLLEIINRTSNIIAGDYTLEVEKFVDRLKSELNDLSVKGLEF